MWRTFSRSWVFMRLKKCSLCKTNHPHSNFRQRGKNNPLLDSWCNDCRRERTKIWGQKNPEKKKESGRRIREALRTQVISHYGGKCVCCGESESKFLCIDHIEGGGTQHRLSLGPKGRGGTFYRWLRDQGFPEGFRTLCHNCNMAKGLYGKCPHEEV